MSVWREGLDGEARIALTVNGTEVLARDDETVATLLLRLGHPSFGRNPVTGAPRAPVCMMGVCFGCLCEIDGRPESQACLEPVRAGMVVVTEGAP